MVGCASRPPIPPAGDDARFLTFVEPGQSRSSIRGCLAAGAQGKKPAPSRGDVEWDGVDLRVVAGGALVIHKLTHPCCLEANVRLTTHGNVAIVQERLAGEPCRCSCQSTIETAIGLGLGMWTVRVEVEEPFEAAKVIDERRVKILERRSETAR